MESRASQNPSMSSHKRTALSRNRTGVVRAPKQAHDILRGAHCGAPRHRLRRKRWRERASSWCSTSSDTAYPKRICTSEVRGVSAVHCNVCPIGPAKHLMQQSTLQDCMASVSKLIARVLLYTH